MIEMIENLVNNEPNPCLVSAPAIHSLLLEYRDGGLEAGVGANLRRRHRQSLAIGGYRDGALSGDRSVPARRRFDRAIVDSLRGNHGPDDGRAAGDRHGFAVEGYRVGRTVQTQSLQRVVSQGFVLLLIGFAAAVRLRLPDGCQSLRFARDALIDDRDEARLSIR